LSAGGKTSLSAAVRVNTDKAAGCGVVLSADMIRVLRCALAYAVVRRFTTMTSSGFGIGHPSPMRGLTPWAFRRSAVDPLGRPRRRCSSAKSQ
jgi:hypothetical protein